MEIKLNDDSCVYFGTQFKYKQLPFNDDDGGDSVVGSYIDGKLDNYHLDSEVGKLTDESVIIKINMKNFKKIIKK